MSDVGFRIFTTITRPEKRLVEAFSRIPVANIADCMNRFFCIDAAIRMLNEQPGLMMAGPAFTIKTRPTDNLMVHKALDMAQPGDVLVIDASGDMSHAVFGEIMVLMAKNNKLAGYVIDGCCRDYDSIRQMDFPVFAKGITPKGPYKDGPGEINCLVSCGGVSINPGDIIVGDHDGVVVIPQAKAEDVLGEAQAVVQKENGLIEDLKKGFNGDRKWVDEKLIEKGCLFS